MSDNQRVGTIPSSAGSAVPFTAGITGASRTADAHGRYLEAVLANRAYALSVAGATPAAYTGGAAGQPLLAIHNPSNSGVLLAVLAVGFACRVGSSAAGNTGLALWGGPSAQPTGTTTVPRNLYTMAGAGSGAVAFANAALTGSTALNLLLPILEYQMIGATPVAMAVSPTFFDLAGLIVAAPGNQIALGLTTAPTSLTADVSLIWEEIPLLTMK